MENNALDILKMAILMERRGKEFYTTVANQAKDENVKNIFFLMSKEEQLHIEQLSEHFKSFMKNGKFEKLEINHVEEDDTIAKLILDPSIKKSISAASFEASAIGAAIDMENKAIEVYSKRAKESTDENEKALYLWLTDFERGHHKLLNDLNKELMEEVWNDNHFWPY
ncbi:MAG: ferritin family protein [Bacteroidota bacterium]|jgi:rubrerythrin